MMKIKIAHLYYDLLNLYGEQGNVLALKNAFKKQGITAGVDLLSINDKINFSKYDIFYMGMGSEENLLLVLEDIKKYKKELKDVIQKGKYFIATGNSQELFGKFIEMLGQKYKALAIFDYYAKENPKRIVGEAFMEFKDLSPIIGFQNRLSYIINDSNHHLFNVLKGHADNNQSVYEGFNKNNFFGTHLLGPLLIRNPHFTNYIVKEILKDKYQETESDFEDDAYQEYLKNFYQN